MVISNRQVPPRLPVARLIVMMMMAVVVMMVLLSFTVAAGDGLGVGEDEAAGLDALGADQVVGQLAVLVERPEQLRRARSRCRPTRFPLE